MRKSKMALAIFVIAVALVAYITVFVKENMNLGIDDSIADIIKTIFPAESRPFFKMIEILGAKPGIAVVGIGFILWLWFKKRNYIGMVTVLIAVAIGNELSKFIKDMIKRARPELEHFTHADGYSFPSGHAMVGSILYIVLLYFIIRELKTRAAKWLVGILFVIIIALIGISRIVLQVHYPTDVIAGYLYGYIWVYLVIVGYELVVKKDHQ